MKGSELGPMPGHDTLGMDDLARYCCPAAFLPS